MGKNELKDVLLVTSDEKSRNYKWDKKSSKIKGVQVISEEKEFENLQKRVTFVGFQKDKEQVFIKNPLDKNEYLEITKAEDHIFKSKIKFYKRIALLLGAKSFSAKANFVEEKKLTIDLDANVSYKAVKIEGQYKKDKNEKINASYDLNSEFKPDEDFDRQRAFKDANDLVKKLNFQNEIDIVGLIENNNPTDQSREKKQNVKLQLTNELNDLLEISFNLNIMGGVFSLGANFKSTTETIKKVILETEIMFD